MAATNMPVYAPSTTDAAPLFSTEHTATGFHSHMPYAAHHAAPMSMNNNHHHAQQQQLQHQQQMMMMMSMQQQQQMMMAMQQQQQQHMMANARPSHNNNNAMHTTGTGRSTRSPNNAHHGTASSGNNNASANNNNANNNGRPPATPFNPAAAMPLEDMIVAYNTVKAREIAMQSDYASEIAASPAPHTIPPFVSPFVDYACSQQGKLVLQGLLHFEDEVAVAQDLFASIGGSIEHIALNEHGCHVIRALGEKIGSAAAVVENEDGTINAEAAAAQNEASLIAFVDSLHETLFLNVCTLSQESRRIPQALFETYNSTRPELFTRLVDIVARNVLYLSATQQGCIALIRIYEASNFAQKRLMAANLVRIIADLSCDSFGNYVVQCLVEHSEIHVAAQYVSSAFVGQCVRLACNKFASNVLEKAIRKLSHIPSVRKVILDELVFDPANVTLCCEDSYANFVVQTLIETCTNAAEFRKVHDRVKGAIANSMYAVKIEARLRSKSFFAAAAAAASAPAAASAIPAAPSAAVTVGGNTPAVQAMMAAAAASQQQQRNSAHSSAVPSPLSATAIAAGPVYNATTAPSSPMIAEATAPAADFSNGHHHNGRKQHSNNHKQQQQEATVTSQPRRDAFHHGTNAPTSKFGSKFNGKFSSKAEPVAAAPAASNVTNSHKTVPAAAPAAPAKHDPLRAEAKRLLDSDQPPARFTPYKPSPFSNSNNNKAAAGNNNKENNSNATNNNGNALKERNMNSHNNNNGNHHHNVKGGHHKQQQQNGKQHHQIATSSPAAGESSPSPARGGNHKGNYKKDTNRAGSGNSSNNNSAPRRSNNSRSRPNAEVPAH